MIFDTHAHYTDHKYDEDRMEVLASLKDAGVAHAVNIGFNWKDIEDTFALMEKVPFLYGTVGFHPDNVGELNEDRFAALRDFAKRDRIVGIGEIGLDYHWMVEDKEVQKDWFVRQLGLAKELDLPVVIHSREATQDTFDIMMKEHAGTTGGVIHCFSGSVEIAKEYVKRDYYLGVGGVVTFKNSKVLKNVVREIPLKYLVLETDCPYLAPSPFRGKRNSSALLTYVAKEIADLKGITPEEVEEVTYQNALDLYRLK